MQEQNPSPTLSAPAGSVSYSTRDSTYFASRQLKRVAGPWRLWALGVAAVISGEFSGWNLGLAVGGFWGLAIATGIITVMYLGLCFSLAEMGTAMPHAGAAYSFARTSMGPWGGFVTGMAENMAYIFTTAVIVFFTASYLSAIFTKADGTPMLPDWTWWLLLYAFFVSLNTIGAEMSFRFSLLITFVALAILTVFFIGSIPKIDFNAYAMDIAPTEDNSKFLPFGVLGIFTALPFAVWFYLGIECVPLAAEETNDPRKDMPKGILVGMGTLVVFALLTLFCNTSMAPGATALGASGEPVLEGFRTIFGTGRTILGMEMSTIFGLLAVAGLIASLHGIMFAYGRQIFSLSRAGYFPTSLSLTHSTFKTPHVALIAGAVLGFVVMLVIKLTSAENAGAIIGGKLLAMSVFGAMISYLLQMVSYAILKLKFPAMVRPYISPLGLGGALTAGLIAAVTLATLFITQTDYRYAAIGAAAWFLTGIAYFALHSRKNLVLAPEEEFALSTMTQTATPPPPPVGKLVT